MAWSACCCGCAFYLHHSFHHPHQSYPVLPALPIPNTKYCQDQHADAPYVSLHCPKPNVLHHCCIPSSSPPSSVLPSAASNSVCRMTTRNSWQPPMASRNPSVTCAADQSPVSCICVTCGGSSTMSVWEFVCEPTQWQQLPYIMQCIDPAAARVTIKWQSCPVEDHNEKRLRLDPTMLWRSHFHDCNVTAHATPA